MCSKLTITTPEGRQWPRSDVFIVNFEPNPHHALVFLLSQACNFIKKETWLRCFPMNF